MHQHTIHNNGWSRHDSVAHDDFWTGFLHHVHGRSAIGGNRLNQFRNFDALGATAP